MSLHYIIDGYNFINHPLFARTHNAKKDPRRALLDFIKQKNLCGSSKNQITVVFDGYSSDFQASQPDNRIDAVFSKEESADERIKCFVEGSRNPKSIVVVSDDKQIRLVVRAAGAACLSIEEFSGRHKETGKKEEIQKPELSYSQIEQINKELRKRWLGDK